MASAETAMSAMGPLGFIGAGLLLEGSASPLPGFMLAAGATTVGAAIVGAAHLRR